MSNQTKRTASEAGTKAKTGRGLLWTGALVLMGEAAFLMMQISAIWQNSGAKTLGWIAAAGATVQRMMALLAWNDGLLLATAAKVLVLCCPLLAIAVGIGMVRSTERSGQLVDAREAATPREGEQK